MSRYTRIAGTLTHMKKHVKEISSDEDLKLIETKVDELFSDIMKIKMGYKELWK